MIKCYKCGKPIISRKELRLPWPTGFYLIDFINSFSYHNKCYGVPRQPYLMTLTESTFDEDLKFHKIKSLFFLVFFTIADLMLVYYIFFTKNIIGNLYLVLIAAILTMVSIRDFKTLNEIKNLK